MRQRDLMTTTSLPINVADVRIGMYIQLDVGWLHHPFPVNRFKITSQSQLDTLRSSGLVSVRFVPAKSDLVESTDQVATAPASPHAHEAASDAPSQREQRAQAVPTVPVPPPSSAEPEAHFDFAAHCYRYLCTHVQSQPHAAQTVADKLVAGYVQELGQSSEAMMRWLSEVTNEHMEAHSVNVMVLSLLLGKAWGFNEQQLYQLGMAALLHDIGKVKLAPEVQELRPHMSVQDILAYEGHVEASVSIGRSMDLAPEILNAIAQHHELANGGGFPLHLSGHALSLQSQILALANCYDRLCNPSAQVEGHTPHEAISVLFAQRRQHFSADVMTTFVHVIGVYPPGSVVQLNDDRFAIVVSVNTSRPLKPHVLVYDAHVPRRAATVLDLGEQPQITIKRSLRPVQLPRPVLEYLSPRPRIHYFFERAIDAATSRLTT